LRDTIGSMLEEAQRLDELIASLLTLARLESDNAALSREPVDVGTAVREVGETVSVLAAEKHQELDISVPEHVEITADRVLLRQALLNIVHNAIRHSPNDTRIRIQATRDGNQVSIAVTDQGPGIAPEHQTKIFDRFYRIDRARGRAAGSYGLGLAIAKWSIERQGGRIDVASTGGAGSTFRILLPV
jgi:signal transduction histidine kinase